MWFNLIENVYIKRVVSVCVQRIDKWPVGRHFYKPAVSKKKTN